MQVSFVGFVVLERSCFLVFMDEVDSDTVPNRDLIVIIEGESEIEPAFGLV